VDHFSWEERDAMGQKWDAIETQRKKIASMEGESTDGERTRTDVLLGGKVVFVQPEKLSCRRGKIVSYLETPHYMCFNYSNKARFP